MEKLISILEEINPYVDWKNAEDLIDGFVIDSIDVISMVAEIESCFNVIIEGIEINPKNFYSAQTIWDLIQSKISEKK